MDSIIIKSPEEQTDLFGHETAEKLFLEMFNKGAIDGSWLICGPKGVGKATLAYRLARFLLNDNSSADQDSLFSATLSVAPTSLLISEQNSVFRSVSQRTNPALKVIECALKPEEIKARQSLLESGKSLDPETERNRKRFSEIRIDDIRDAESFMHLTSGKGKKRVLIIDTADDMNSSAANALLKTLEEPPANTVILLISHTPGRLLPTIRSRCRKVVLKPLEFNSLYNQLKALRPTLSDDEVRSVCLLAEGSAGKALTIADNKGLLTFKGLLNLLANFPRISVPKLYDFTDKIYKDKDQFQLMQDLFIQWLTRVCVQSQSPDTMTEIVSGEQEIIKKISMFHSPLTLMDLLESITFSFGDLKLDRKQVFVNAVLKLQRGL